ncbi:predicted protein [Sclerotinia sclerotiorum 1980 UF-70]|uniref:Uncharacterized protein n=1 Tax=Sclerotinia sclerotiorum (strain ATCC 18683 / 1980 / Ss-1) TaxID=665079 RepID=A7EPB1_SCLS1|nr:predicted protein [Sclerotinia sclerotiorum 1980 UF-70]EDO04677.1 predicted protein [Sclerotinia sclerotiorum 1980 UF-70]
MLLVEEGMDLMHSFHISYSSTSTRNPLHIFINITARNCLFSHSSCRVEYLFGIDSRISLKLNLIADTAASHICVYDAVEWVPATSPSVEGATQAQLPLSPCRIPKRLVAAIRLHI